MNNTTQPEDTKPEPIKDSPQPVAAEDGRGEEKKDVQLHFTTPADNARKGDLYQREARAKQELEALCWIAYETDRQVSAAKVAYQMSVHFGVGEAKVKKWLRHITREEKGNELAFLEVVW